MTDKQYVIDDITVQDSWRLFRIMAEFVEGFETLAECHPAVSIFGSTRVKPEDDSLPEGRTNRSAPGREWFQCDHRRGAWCHGGCQ